MHTPPPPAADREGRDDGRGEVAARTSGTWWCGVVAVAVALGVSESLAALVRPVPSLVTTVGDAVVDAVSGTPLKDLAVAVFGTADKTALIVGTVVLALLAGAGLGRLAPRRPLLAAGGIAAAGVLAVVATAANPLADPRWAAPAALLTAAVGITALRWLVGMVAQVDAVEQAAPGGTATARAARGRREVVRLGALLAAAGAGAGVLGRVVEVRAAGRAAAAAVPLPGVAAAVRVPDVAGWTDVAGLTPLQTPVEDFYRIDTALTSPVVDADTWRLRISGMVEREVELTYDELMDLPQVEADITISCVSNEVGGDLVGTARWQGVRLADVLDLAGVDPAATQVIGRSVDGWTAGFPTEVAYDGRDALVAVGMQGVPLPIDHGFPARLVVPGLYGYVSATKWLAELELTTWEAADGYWIPRGWSKEGPIKVQSRIDVPASGADVPRGEVLVAGVAWAPHRGIRRVEVQVDDGPWREAELAEELSPDVWRQWRLRWDAPAGEHRLRVRATDGDGTTQRGTPVPPAPDGAEGWHTRVVRVA